ncbi:MAG: UDP-glucose 4-epimerase GalE [Pirellulaceae bacterium]|nr:UDP-glucose 4-epimerase GalE [Pirellulaceae bacterium]
MKILVTGGAGYIGSHTCVELLNSGYEVIVVDNLSNSSEISLQRVEAITGKTVTFYKADLLDTAAMDQIFSGHDIHAVIHFAAFKAVGESVAKPLMYFHNNIAGTVSLCETMVKHHVKNIVFSSSATVYGDPASVPIKEDFPLSATNPYGRTKLMMEQILGDVYVSDNDWNIVLLRYFNPVGAHKSGTIGEDPSGIPNNLMPFVSQVAVGKREKLSVFGDDYPTPDGTGVRDYIHVVDLAVGHVKAIEKLKQNPGLFVCNLGTGQGYSVLEMVKAFEKASGKPVPYEIVDRRPGDIAECYAEPTLAKEALGWEATRGLEEMCEDNWRWQSQNPNGFE